MRRESHRGAYGLAALLHWSEDRVIRVAAQHGIDVRIRMVVDAAPALIELQPPSPRALTSADISALPLTLRQRGLLVALRKAGDRNMASAEIGKLLGVDPSCAVVQIVGVHVRETNARLKDMPWFIEGRKGPGGGYRLIARPA
jgi:hypothetical protein